ncbi:MAG: hypothetical protein VW600_12985 [Ferrovibrio sp.]
MLLALVIIHTALSLIAIAFGIVVLADLLRGRDSGRVAALFLATAVLTSATGFLFPFTQLLPSHVTAIVALLVLALTIPARYRFGLTGLWRGVYAGGSVASLFLLVFVLIAQTFAKVPALRALAPTQTEPPFAVTQIVALAIFIILGLLAVRRFHPTATVSAAG